MNRYPHAIRLRGPWEAEGSATSLSVPFLVSEDAVGNAPVRLRRTFNWVARVDPDEVVWLVLAYALGRIELAINDIPLRPLDPFWGSWRCDVTALLRPRNRIELVLRPPGAGSSHVGVLGGLGLEIESRRCALRATSIQTRWSPTGGGLALRADPVGIPEPCHYRIAIGGRPIAVGEWTADRFNGGGCDVVVDGLDVAPWWPWSTGSPVLHPLEWTVFDSAGRPLFVVDQAVGFRTTVGLADGRWLVNRIPVRGGPRSFSIDETFPFAQGSSTSLFEQLTGVAIARLDNHLAPTSFYDACDSLGILVEHTLPLALPGERLPITGPAGFEPAGPAVVSHPCVGLPVESAGRSPCGFPQGYPDPTPGLASGNDPE